MEDLVESRLVQAVCNTSFARTTAVRKGFVWSHAGNAAVRIRGRQYMKLHYSSVQVDAQATQR